MYLRKGKQNQNLLTKRTNDIQFILEQIQKFHNVSIWGAGAKSQAMMTACGSKFHINHVFDTDKYKQGKYLINCDKKIEYPDMEKINSNDLIIIFAVSYEDEIMRMLRDDFKYKGYILSLEGKAKIINI
ncbi:MULTISPECIES: hypothetical protein [Clostridium]|uniref:hypothetical protein n=1 Tax=Clostridium TaxID=1485 RepID=UPI00241ED347|nr:MULTISPECIES: hypothetical protein [Clostridium]